jgi:anti-sigma factor RsiW
MTCDQCQAELTGFQLGVVDGGVRDALEEHLQGCAGCLRSFLRLKRAMETAELEPAPSDAVRMRLRASVAAELSASQAPADRPWRWWERPLAFALAGASVLVAFAFVQGLSLTQGFPPVMP